MLAVIDGLGHGPEAAQASRAAVELLGSLPLGTPVLEAMQGLHAALRGTRGAAATVCMIDGLHLEVCAVGNVQLLCVNVDVPLVLSAGVLGHHVARFRVSGCELRLGARLALISDGISTRFRLEELRNLEPAAACEHILAKYRRKEDDATVLIADLGR
jgi:negative regulator of sigma-B (phosphoserine phosphatase)